MEGGIEGNNFERHSNVMRRDVPYIQPKSVYCSYNNVRTRRGAMTNMIATYPGLPAERTQPNTTATQVIKSSDLRGTLHTHTNLYTHHYIIVCFESLL
jgi:hypothetical protein